MKTNIAIVIFIILVLCVFNFVMGWLMGAKNTLNTREANLFKTELKLKRVIYEKPEGKGYLIAEIKSVRALAKLAEKSNGYQRKFAMALVNKEAAEINYLRKR